MRDDFGTTNSIDQMKPMQTNIRSCHSTRDIRRLVRMIWQLERGVYSNIETFYGSISKYEGLFPLYACCTLIGAIGNADRGLFDRVYADLVSRTRQNLALLSLSQNAQTENGMPDSRTEKDDFAFGVEAVLVWIRLLLRVDAESPSWVKGMDFSAIPPDWRLVAGFLKAQVYLRDGEPEMAYMIVKMLLEVCPRCPGGTVMRLYLMKACAEVCRDLGNADESAYWFRQLAKHAGRRGFVHPYLGMPMGTRTPAEMSLAASAPELMKKIKRQSVSYQKVLVRFHNHLTGEKIANNLSPREFYIAQELKRKRPYKVIAEQMDISPGRINILVRTIYEKLNVHSRKELVRVIW